MSVSAKFGGRSDAGWVASTGIQQAAAIAVAIRQANAAKDLAIRQENIAKGYLAIANELNNFWRSDYKPIEIKTSAEIYAEAKHTPEYDEQAGRFATTARGQFSEAYHRLEQCFQPHCTGLRQVITRELVTEEARAVSDSINYAYRYAEARAEALNDVRWSRMTQMIGLGRGLVTTSLSYSQSAQGIYSSIGAQMNASLASTSRGLGYILNRDNSNAQVPQINYQTPGINPNAQGAITNRNSGLPQSQMRTVATGAQHNQQSQQGNFSLFNFFDRLFADPNGVNGANGIIGDQDIAGTAGAGVSGGDD